MALIRIIDGKYIDTTGAMETAKLSSLDAEREGASKLASASDDLDKAKKENEELKARIAALEAASKPSEEPKATPKAEVPKAK